MEMGRVRIGLVSGFVLEGTPVKMDGEGNVIFTSENNTISYVNTASLAGIEILNPDALMEVLTNGNFIKVPEGEVRTLLQLKREFKAQAEFAEKQYGFKFQTTLFEEGLTTEAEKYQFQEFLKLFQEVLTDTEKDSLGKEAIMELEEVTLQAAEKAISCSKTGAHLLVGINFKNKFSKDFNDRLKMAFESTL